ncbi:MAG: M20/M25/M40 family metallo-hydrolase [Opitutaceae bacterium]|nr:M20/M25/M40 family metallo-hydrolase [Opitutaceae bacterium]
MRRPNLSFIWTPTQDNAAVTCSTARTALLTASVRAGQGPQPRVAQRCGHDVVVMSALTPAAMLFGRSRAGLSHHPDESSSPADIAVALHALIDFLTRLARTHPS